MKVQFKSDSESVAATVTADGFGVLSAPVSTFKPSAARKVAVRVQSTAEQVSLSVKPSVIAQEDRQERLSRTFKLGHPPISKSTKG